MGERQTISQLRRAQNHRTSKQTSETMSDWDSYLLKGVETLCFSYSSDIIQDGHLHPLLKQAIESWYCTHMSKHSHIITFFVSNTYRHTWALLHSLRMYVYRYVWVKRR
jgi:hypothetical protein